MCIEQSQEKGAMLTQNIQWPQAQSRPRQYTEVIAAAPVGVTGVHNQYELQCVYKIFGKFLMARKKKYPQIDTHTQLPSIDEMVEWDRKPNFIFLNVPGDRYCEFKGREHNGDTSGAQTGYGWDSYKLVVWQTCFSCRPNRCQEPTSSMSFTPYGEVFGSLKPDLYECLIFQEMMVTTLFIEEHRDWLRVCGPVKDRQLYIFDEGTRRWRCDTHSFIWKTFPLWINRKALMMRRFGSIDPTDKALGKWVKEYTRVGKVSTLLTFIKQSCYDEEFGAECDRIPNLIPLKNGDVFDVLTGESRKGTRADKFTQSMEFNLLPFDHPDLEEVTERFLEFGCGDMEWVGYMQEWLGYNFTGYMNDRGLVLHDGVGSNGKGTTGNALQNAMGPFFSIMNHKFFNATGTQGDGESASPLAASLSTVRCLMIPELPPNMKFDWAKLKSWTAGDPQKVRGLYQSGQTWRPVVKINVCTNHIPEIETHELAVTDRFRAANWRARFVESPTRENDFRANAAIAERMEHNVDAFGTWCIIGALRVCEKTDGFKRRIPRPLIIQHFIDKVIKSADLLMAFIRQLADFSNPGATWDAVAMYNTFRAWVSRVQATQSTLTVDTFVTEVQKRVFGFDVSILEKDSIRYFRGMKQKVIIQDNHQDEVTRDTHDNMDA